MVYPRSGACIMYACRTDSGCRALYVHNSMIAINIVLQDITDSSKLRVSRCGAFQRRFRAHTPAPGAACHRPARRSAPFLHAFALSRPGLHDVPGTGQHHSEIRRCKAHAPLLLHDHRMVRYSLYYGSSPFWISHLPNTTDSGRSIPRWSSVQSRLDVETGRYSSPAERRTTDSRQAISVGARCCERKV